jgi:hypothetical protein
MSAPSRVTERREGDEVSAPDGDVGRRADSPAASRPVRHPGDLVRVATGGLVHAAGGEVARQGRLSSLETGLFRLVHDLAGALDIPLRAAMQAGSLPAVPLAALAALAARRPRLARDVALAGGGAWAAARVLKTIVGRGRPGTLLWPGSSRSPSWTTPFLCSLRSRLQPRMPGPPGVPPTGLIRRVEG